MVPEFNVRRTTVTRRRDERKHVNTEGSLVQGTLVMSSPRLSFPWTPDAEAANQRLTSVSSFKLGGGVIMVCR